MSEDPSSSSGRPGLARRIRTALSELRRRRVWKLAALYCGGALVLWEVADIATDALGTPEWIMPALVWATVAGFPLALVLGWIFDLTPRGIERTGPREEEADAPAGAPASTRNPPPLPSQTTPLVGRTREVESLLALLGKEEVRLVSLVGPGGVGKTRVAVTAARRIREGTEGAVHFVALDDAPGTGGPLVTAVATALGFRVPNPTLSAVAEALDGASLLVLDGMPPGDEAGSLVHGLLARVPGLTVLVTARARLGARSEHVVALEGLPVGTSAEDEGAMRLFVLAARRRLPEFEPSDEDAATIGEICRALGGLPLAVELAGGWTDVLSPAAILEEIRARRHLDLASPHADAPERQRSLAAVARGSFDRLPAGERTAARAAAVFRNAFTPEAARVVAGATPESIRHMVDASLLHPTGEGRFRMHPLLADHARAAWTEDERREVARRHGDYFLRRLGELGTAVAGDDPEAALEAFDAESDDLEAAWTHAVENDRREALESGLDALFLLAERRGRLVSLETLLSLAIERTEADGSEQQELAGRLRVQRGRARHRLGRPAAAVEDLVAGLERLPKASPGPGRAAALNAMGDVMAALGRYDEARRFCQEALAIFRARDDHGGVAATLTNLGVVAQSRFRLDEARERHEESLAISQQIGDHHGVAHALNNLGAVAHDTGDLPAAEELYGRGLEAARAAGDPGGVAAALANLGRVAYRRGELERARRRSREALAIFVETGDELGTVACTLNLADVALAEGEQAAAEELLLAALERAARKEAKPLAGEALIGLAELRRSQGRAAEAAALLAPTARCRELDPEAMERRDALLAELDPPAPDDDDDVPTLRQVAQRTLDSAKEQRHGQGTPLQAHRAGSELSVRGSG